MEKHKCMNDPHSGQPKMTPTDTRPSTTMRIPVVTQNTPEERRMPAPDRSQAPSQEQLEQDVIATNPSVESMDSRG